MLDQATAYGLEFLFPAADEAVGASLRDYGEFSRIMLDWLLSEADGSGALIDVGANLGSVCLPFAAKRPAWRVLAIEAHQGLSQILSANVKQNRLANVTVLTAAAGDASGVVDFPAPPLDRSGNHGTLSLGDSSSALRSTRMVTLDEIAPPNTRLVKIDVEGFEPAVLAGAAGLLAGHGAAWVIEASVQHPEAARAVLRLLRGFGYQPFWFYVPHVTPANGRAMPGEPALGDANVVALPPGAVNRWNLTPVLDPDEARPRAHAAYRYLDRYGYAPRART